MGSVFLKNKNMLAGFGLTSGPDEIEQALGFIWSLFRAKPSILDPFWIKFDGFGPDRNFAQPGLDLTGTLDTSSEAALYVKIRNQTQN